MTSSWKLTTLSIIVLWLVFFGIFIKQAFPRLIQAAQTSVIFVSLVLLLYLLLNRFYHRG